MWDALFDYLNDWISVVREAKLRLVINSFHVLSNDKVVRPSTGHTHPHAPHAGGNPMSNTVITKDIC